MTRAVLLAVGLLTLAACSSGGNAEPPPPLDTEALTTTIEPAPTTEAPAPTTTSTTSTTVAETTTTVPSVEAPSTDPVATVDPEVVAEIDALTAEAFVDYEATWLLTRSAFEDPSNETIREDLIRRFVEGSGKSVFDALNRFVDANEKSLPAGPEEPQGVVLIRSVGGAGDLFAVFQACETLSSDIVDAGSGAPTYEGVDSTLREVQMVLEEGEWLLLGTTTIESFEGAACE